MQGMEKAVAAIVGMVLTLISPYVVAAGFEVSTLAQDMTQGIMGILTVFAVYQVRNK